jgi:hypothetical protein
MRLLTALLIIFMAAGTKAQEYRCDSIGAATTGAWRPLAEAPHDGTLVEELNTYGVAPTYGVFKFVGSGGWIAVDPAYVKHSGQGTGLISEVCQWFRPFKGKLSEYVDPTHGAQ